MHICTLWGVCACGESKPDSLTALIIAVATAIGQPSPAQLSSSATTQTLPNFLLAMSSQLFIPGPCTGLAILINHLLWPKSLKSSVTPVLPSYPPYNRLANAVTSTFKYILHSSLDTSIATKMNFINLVIVSW